MKKTLLILSLMSVAGLASAATTYAEKQTIDSATALGNSTAVYYNGGLELTAEGSLLKPADNSWSNAYINGLFGSGSINVDRPGGGTYADLIWLDGTCSEFTGSVTVNGNEHMGATGLIVGNTNAAFSMANANVTVGKGTNTNGHSIMALVNDASLATANGKTFMMKEGMIRHIAAPTAFSDRISKDNGLPAVTDTAVTLTLGATELDGVTVEKGVQMKIQGTANISGNGSFADDVTATGTVNFVNGGTTTVSEGATLDLQNIKLTGNSILKVEQGAAVEFSMGGATGANRMKVESLGETAAQVKGTAGNTFAPGRYGYGFSDASLTLTAVSNQNTTNALFTNVDVTNAGGNTYTFQSHTVGDSGFNGQDTFRNLTAADGGIVVNDGSATASTLKNVTATGGDVTVYNLGEGTQLESLTLSNGKNISFYSSADSTALASVGLTTQLTVTGADSTLNANLAVNGATLTFADDALLTVSGSVTLSNAVVALTQTMVDTIAANGRVDLFTGMTNVDLGNITFVRADGQELAQAGVYKVSFDGTSIYVTPEPATATLSLLALAALAARRKRA